MVTKLSFHCYELCSTFLDSDLRPPRWSEYSTTALLSEYLSLCCISGSGSSLLFYVLVLQYSHLSPSSHDQTALSTLLKGLGHCVGLCQIDHEMHSSFYSDNMTSKTFLQILIGENLFNCYKKQISFLQLLWKPQYLFIGNYN